MLMTATHQANAQGCAYARRTFGNVLKVSAIGRYDWRDREPSARAVANERLGDRIEQIHEWSKAIYGEPKIRTERGDHSVAAHDAEFAGLGKHRVARLMRARRLHGVCKRRSYTVTTERNKKARPAPDLVERAFVADMTYVPMWVGFTYLAVVLEVRSRRIVGWAIGETKTSDLVISALNMALSKRTPTGSGGAHPPQRSR